MKPKVFFILVKVLGCKIKIYFLPEGEPWAVSALQYEKDSYGLNAL